MKDIEERLIQYLPKPGQTVYLQTPGVRNRARKVSVTHYVEEGAIDFFNSLHGKLITNDDFNEMAEKYANEEGKLGKKIELANGQMAIVLASFHWGFTEKEIEEFLEEKKIESAEEATPSVVCFLLTGDMFVMAGLRKCNIVDL